jgi:hypothetical protein
VSHGSDKKSVSILAEPLPKKGVKVKQKNTGYGNPVQIIRSGKG